MKSLAKSILRAIAVLMVLPAVALYRMQSALMGPGEGFPAWSQFFSLFPGVPGEYLRQAFYKVTTAGCGDDACISFGTIMADHGIQIGRSAYVGNFCSLGKVTIGDDVLVASHVSIMNGCRQHGTARLDIPIREQPGTFTPVSVGNGSWIGEHATVAASVGQHCIVGAGALVLQPLPDYAIAVGSPARIIADRRDKLCRETAPDNTSQEATTAPALHC